MEKSIVVIAEHFQGELKPVTYELVACAFELQKLFPADVKIIIVGDEVEGIAKKIATDTGLDVIGVQDPNLVFYNGEVYTGILVELLPDLYPKYVCIAHTTQGWDYAPGLAVRLRASCITGVGKAFRAHDRICFTRSIYNGKLVAVVSPSAELTVLTIQPGIFKLPTLHNPTPGSVDMRTVSHPPQQSRTVGIKRTKVEDSALAEAQVIVSAGRGIGKKENLGLIYQLAALFPKSAVGGSRPVCDMGWLEYKRQVGLTGTTVTPKLYLACGISGAPQHIAGMGGAGFIVAINTDPDAAIFNVADVCIVEDLTTFIPACIEEWEKGL